MIDSATQNPSIVRLEVARLFDLPEAMVQIRTAFLGGGFGAKLYPKLEPLVAACAVLTRRPVRLALSMDETFLTLTRHGSTIRVTSGVDAVHVWDVSDAVHPTVVGVLPNALFENEAMTCGERRTADGVRRFALIGVDSVQASPTDPAHVNVGGNELIVVDVTDPANPRIVGRAPGTTSTHTVACVDDRNCRYAYSAGDGDQADP